MIRKHLLMLSAAGLLAAVTAGPLQGAEPGPAHRIEHSVKVLSLPANWADTTPVYAEPELAYVYNAHTYKCTECHDDLASPPKKSHLPFGAHKDMLFDHGLNLRCLNCHNVGNPEAYIDHDGSEISKDTPVLLCRKCHGGIYRDWEARVHGRINTYWSAAYGPLKNLACNQCHNPHHPKFPSLRPMPPPQLPHRAGHRKEAGHE